MILRRYHDINVAKQVEKPALTVPDSENERTPTKKAGVTDGTKRNKKQT